MSLSLPHILRAAVERIPRARLRLAEQVLTVSELERHSRAAAEEWLAAGYRPGDVVVTDGLDEPLVARLGAGRVGIVVADGGAPGPPSAASSTGGAGVPEVDVLEDAVWSETPLWRGPDGVTRSHGEAIAAADGDGEPFPPELIGFVRALRG